jgi:peptidoglycan-N-acetylglucosamine deacetylase
MAHLDNPVGEFLGFALRMNPPERLSHRWSPAPLLYASAAVHLGAAAAIAARPHTWPWALGAVLANHVALAGAGLWPRSQWLGPNWVRLPAQIGRAGGVAITIDDGPDPRVTPQVLAQLEQYQACATFFCVGERVLRYPDLAQEIIRRGHTIENHSQRHRHNFSLLGPKGLHDEISRAQDSILRVTGSCPGFFRAPAGLRNPFLDPVLWRMQLQLASWTRRGFDTVSGDAEVVFRRLATALQGGDILLLHDGHAARGRDDTAVILKVLPRLLDALRARSLQPVTLRAAWCGSR